MRKRIGEILISQGFITRQTLDDALKRQMKDRSKWLGVILVEMGAIDDEAVAKSLAVQYDYPYVNPMQAPVDPGLLWKVPRELAERYTLLPLERRDDGNVKVAMADPNSFDAIRDLEFLLRATVQPHVASATNVRQAIRRHYDLAPDAARMLSGAEPKRRAGAGGHLLEIDPEKLKVELKLGGMTPYIHLLNYLILNAIERRASDIHLEPETDSLRVRFRVDGMLREVLRLPSWAEPPLVSRIKVVGELDVATRRKPQDGKVTATIEGRRIDMRIAVVPSQFGEKVTIRLLDPNMLATDLGVMGWQPRALSAFYRMVSQPQGMVLVVGPTGSGKSTTLYGTINRLRGEQTSIVTIEDPIEYSVEGITQIQVDEKAGMTFAHSVRSLLRQDPNVIVIGEIRDEETAAAATQAATTGHLVLSTLHTQHSIGAVTRLLDLGIPPYILGAALLGIVAQRLVRRVCAQCSVLGEVEEEDWNRVGVQPLPLERVRRAGPGCPTCQYTGYSGRVGVFEVLHMSDAMRGLVMDRGSEQALWVTARDEGLTTMIDDALYKVNQGITSMEEVARVVPADPWRPEGDAARRVVGVRPWRPTWAEAEEQAARAEREGAPHAGGEARKEAAPVRPPAAPPVPAASAAAVAQPAAPRPGGGLSAGEGALGAAPPAGGGGPARDGARAGLRADLAPAPEAASAAPPVLAAAAVSGSRAEPEVVAQPPSLRHPSAFVAKPEAAATVLVVDDAPEILQLVTVTLEDSYTVRLARDGVEALEEVEKEKPDLIVLDVMMPRLSGYDVCLRLKEDPATEQIPILMLSARGERAHITKGFYAGADDYLPKPFDPEELELRIRALLRRSRRSPRAAT